MRGWEYHGGIGRKKKEKNEREKKKVHVADPKSISRSRELQN